MTILKFTDNVVVDTSGPPRVLKLSDGYYAVGNGMLIPTKTKDDAEVEVRTMIIESSSNPKRELLNQINDMLGMKKVSKK